MGGGRSGIPQRGVVFEEDKDRREGMDRSFWHHQRSKRGFWLKVLALPI